MFSLEDYNFPSLKKGAKEMSQKCIHKIQITNKRGRKKTVLITINRRIQITAPKNIS